MAIPLWPLIRWARQPDEIDAVVGNVVRCGARRIDEGTSSL